MKRFISVAVMLSVLLSIGCYVFADEDTGERTLCTGSHVWDAGTVSKYPTCRDSGRMDFVCTSCGARKTEIIPSDPEHCHVYDSDCDTACNICGAERQINHINGDVLHSDASGHYYYCKVCGEITGVEAHKFGAENADGVSICEVCGYAVCKSESHVHTLTVVKEKDATCTEPGNKKYYKCTGCDAIFSDSKGTKPITDPSSVVIAPKHHELAVEAGTKPTCSSGGETGKTVCAVCGTVVLSPCAVPTVSHDFSVAYDTDFHCIKCNVCGFTANKESHSLVLIFSDDDKLGFECDCGFSPIFKSEDIKRTDGELVIDVPMLEKDAGKGFIRVSGKVLSFLHAEIVNPAEGVSKVRVNFGDANILLDKYSLSNVLYTDDERVFVLGYSFVGNDNSELNQSQLDAVKKLSEGSKVLRVAFDCTEYERNSAILTNSVISVKYDLPTGWSADDVCVYRLDTDGVLDKAPAEYDGTTLTFRNDRFGMYVITTPQEGDGGKSNTGHGMKPQIIVVDILIALAVLAAIIFFVVRKFVNMNPYRDYDE